MVKKELQEEKENKIKLDFTKKEYEYFCEECMFGDIDKEILKYKVQRKSLVEISFLVNMSVDNVKKRIRYIKNKIKRVI